MNKKVGNAAITNTIIFFITTILLIYLGIYLFNIMSVFVWYQKLNNIYEKYRLIIESYGNLTEKEEKNLYSDLKAEGFEPSKIEVDIPKDKKYYGDEVKFEIKYSVSINKLKLVFKEEQVIDIKVGNSFIMV